MNPSLSSNKNHLYDKNGYIPKYNSNNNFMANKSYNNNIGGSDTSAKSHRNMEKCYSSNPTKISGIYQQNLLP